MNAGNTLRGGVCGTCHRGRLDGMEGLAERTRHAAWLVSDRHHVALAG